MAKKTAKQDIGVFDITAALDRLSLTQLNNLKRHRYSASGISILTPVLGYGFLRIFTKEKPKQKLNNNYFKQRRHTSDFF